MDVRMEESWRRVLADEFDRDYFRQLVSKVHEEYGTTGRHCYPPGHEIFAAFDQTPFDKVKVVIIGQDPYHGPGQANGLAFSVNDGVRIPPSLQNIFK